jgi:8-oxo-dGTP pyrophosphatase MutT (NUDIX family)
MYKPFNSILKTRFFGLEEALPQGANSGDPYYRITGVDSVISCILDQFDNFVLIRQYRPNLEMFTLESPAGGIDKSESPIQAMQREILEETGLRCALLPIGIDFRLMMNRTNIRDHLFFGMLPEEVTEYTPEVGIELIRVPRVKLLDMALCGEFMHLATLGIMQLAGGALKVDMWHSPYDLIKASFQSHTKVTFYDKK